VRYEHPLIASLLIGAAQEADLVSPGFEQSTAISNHSTLDFTLHYDEQRIVLLGDVSWKRLCSSSVPHADDDDDGDERETAFLFQRVSVLVQRFNGVLLHDSFVLRTAQSNGHSDNFSEPLEILHTAGKKKILLCNDTSVKSPASVSSIFGA